jgi:hypothetical protein
VTVLDYNGNYSPRNVGAVWVTDAAGVFKHSLVVWGNKRLSHLPKWQAASGGNKLDAVTSATASNTLSPHKGTWNCADPTEAKVPDGEYQVWVEYTQDNTSVFNPPAYATIPFTKGATPLSTTPADIPGAFTAMPLTYSP